MHYWDGLEDCIASIGALRALADAAQRSHVTATVSQGPARDHGFILLKNAFTQFHAIKAVIPPAVYNIYQLIN
jgi:hypothetical protein